MPELIQKILSGNYISPDDGKVLNVPISRVEIDGGLVGNADILVDSLNIGRRILPVCDKNTYPVAGRDIERKLSAQSLVLKDKILPDMGRVKEITDNLTNIDAVVAIGSGTINDLCKYASYQAGKPYIVFGTAPSMNGYASANVSLIKGGVKQSFQAHLPQAVFLDTDILAAAPRRLIQSGIGDSICRTTAQADWMLSHFLLGTEYKQAPFDILHDCEQELFAVAPDNAEFIEVLAENLILSGIGMYISGGSYPASQAEHMIAHYVESKYGSELPESFHGEQIAVTTLMIAELQEKILAQDKVELKDEPLPEKGLTAEKISEINRLLKENWGDCHSAALHGKASRIQNTETRSCAKLYTQFPQDDGAEKIEKYGNIHEQIKKITKPSTEIRKMLEKHSCPTNYKDLGWSEEIYNDALKNARKSRGRFTFLNLT